MGVRKPKLRVIQLAKYRRDKIERERRIAKMENAADAIENCSRDLQESLEGIAQCVRSIASGRSDLAERDDLLCTALARLGVQTVSLGSKNLRLGKRMRRRAQAMSLT